jgi:release factor glutamine methyltransferase
MLDSLSTHPLGAVAAALRASGSVFAEDEARLLVEAAPTDADLETMVERRVRGVPLEYILGWAEFCGRRIAVDPGVFVPRRRTEFLAGQALELTRAAADSGTPAGGRTPVVVELCCGTGAVAVTLAKAVGDIDLYATDIDPAAVRCARRNLGDAARVLEGDLCDPLPPALRQCVDVMVANVPYVPTHAIALLAQEARLHEPRVALDGGADGLDVVRRVAQAAPQWLATGGHVLVETGGRQAGAAAEIFGGNGLMSRVASYDDLDAIVVIATRP